jgi:hypothetical protein
MNDVVDALLGFMRKMNKDPTGGMLPNLSQAAENYDPATETNASRKLAYKLGGPMGAVASDWLPITSTANAFEDFKNADNWQDKASSGFGLFGMQATPGRKIKDLKGNEIDLPRRFYRGTNPGDERRIRTGNDDWDSHLFAASNEQDAGLYGSHIDTLDAAPDANILYEGTEEWRRVAGAWRKGENMLEYADRASKAAKAAGFDAAWFKRQGDIGTAIFNPDKFSGPQQVQQQQASITAYHGSPHDFDAFDSKFIGAGEGAQAYGHGLYFAEREGVAKSYRDRLARSVKSHFEAGGTRLTPAELEKMRNVSTKSATPAVQMLLANNNAFSALKSGNQKKFQGILDERLAYLDKQAAEYAKRAEDFKINPPYRSTLSGDDLANRATYAKREADELRAFSGGLAYNPKHSAGHMYEVNIDADPDDFLDWDKPLSEQSERVRNAATALNVPNAHRPHVTGSAAYHHLGGEEIVAGRARPGSGVEKIAAAKAFQDQGIPGIRYLDQGSRTAGDGSHNYVVFDDKLISIMRKYGLALPGLGAAGAMGSTYGTNE